ncbi:integrator complex subunit 7-like [Neopsephotus bourkii]|uniref:integrator complex subunit 7-like n=1 Tax=Neopsephotus bourkii TaxID=309878 RepID=UPI002AA51D2E|nr:integrator complex subunit 7-like [Neopsephotus bourkii]
MTDLVFPALEDDLAIDAPFEIELEEMASDIFTLSVVALATNTLDIPSTYLTMLGSMASIIPERKDTHHSIRQSLDSHDNVEFEAAIFAAANFSAQTFIVKAQCLVVQLSLICNDFPIVFISPNTLSFLYRDFAAGICNKISEMIQGLATPVDLKLIPILQHMHHDASLASSSRQLLQQPVTSYPSTKMVTVTLHTFTLLAAASLVDIPKQIQLLLQYLKNDPRKAVKRLAIQDLKLLANKTLHTWRKYSG